MVAEFSAAHITCLDESGVVSVAFGGAPGVDGDPQYLLLSRTLVPDAQDLSLGLDGPYFELSDQSKSVYGGISLVRLSRRQVRVVLNAHGAKLVGESEVCVAFVPSDGYDRMEQTLRRVLDGVKFSADAV